MLSAVGWAEQSPAWATNTYKRQNSPCLFIDFGLKYVEYDLS